MESTRPLEAAREALARADWAAARAGFLAARERGPLSAEDANALGDAAWWLGDVEGSLAAYEEAYRLYLGGDRPRQAAISALGVATNLYLRGDEVVGSGWMSRAQRLLRDQPESAEHGYVMYLDAEASLEGPDARATVDGARRVQELGRRFDDPTLMTIGTVIEGRARIRIGDVREGMALLDEAMLTVLSDKLAPDWTGNAYCHLVAACMELADLRRAGEWTDALARWCERVSPAVVFTGVCRVHRAQLFQVRGAWDHAEAEATRVCQEVAGIHRTSEAEAFYSVGEIRRLRGDLDGAADAYAKARELGRDPQPGTALMTLAQGRREAALASVTASLAATSDRLARARLLPGLVEIALAAGRVEQAHTASEELDELAATFETSGLRAAAFDARGRVRLAEGAAGEALETLRKACSAWQALDAPYNAARVRMGMAEACRALGDADGAELELDAARSVFDRLGAGPDLARIDQLRGRPWLPDGLTAREAEVLALVAAGRSNREVAEALFISEKTVARHLSNIFAKAGLSSRTEAAAYAHEHGLATRRG